MRKLCFLLFLPIVASCLEDPQCVQLDNDEIRLQFYDRADPSVRLDLMVDSLVLKNDGTVIFGTDQISEIPVFLNPELENMEFVLFTEAGKDSFMISYSYIPKLFAPDCEVEPLYSQVELIYASFDSLVFDNQSIPANARVYY